MIYLKAGKYREPDPGDSVYWVEGKKPSGKEYLESIGNSVWVIASDLPSDLAGVTPTHRYENSYAYDFDSLQRPDLLEAVRSVMDSSIDCFSARGELIEDISPLVHVGHFGHDYDSDESWIY
jgi:hypothetical protein